MIEEKDIENVAEEKDEINNDEKGKNKKERGLLYKICSNIIVPLLIAFGISLCIQKFLVYKVYIPSASMAPTINEGDSLFVRRIYNLDKIERGDILVFESDELNDVLIKRVIGLPGDKIRIEDGTVYVNDKKIDDSYVKNKANNSGEYKVPDGCYFFLGDNRADSYDSSRWDNPYIDGSKIRGKAFIRVAPISEFGLID